MFVHSMTGPAWFSVCMSPTADSITLLVRRPCRPRGCHGSRAERVCGQEAVLKMNAQSSATSYSRVNRVLGNNSASRGYLRMYMHHQTPNVQPTTTTVWNRGWNGPRQGTRHYCDSSVPRAAPKSKSIALRPCAVFVLANGRGLDSFAPRLLESLRFSCAPSHLRWVSFGSRVLKVEHARRVAAHETRVLC